MSASTTEELLERARAGDREAFGALVAPHRHELGVHCYRILVSVQDAEDVMQEVLLSAWQGIGGFEQRASIRTWLYRIATNRCLNHLRDNTRRLDVNRSLPLAPDPTRSGEVLWLEPCPDVLLEGLADRAPGPEARYEATEAVSLAFVTALQVLSPRQRSALILRDVLGFSAFETAEILGASLDSVNGALKRARLVMDQRFGDGERQALTANSQAERDLVERFTYAYEARDVEALIGLLTEDVWLTMPPIPLEYQGRDLVRRFYTSVVFRNGRSFRFVPTRANCQPAIASYVRDLHTPIAHAHSLLVLTTRRSRISAITRFDTSVFPMFGLPRTLAPPD
jgi:RNA polymerase sigma-70 factor (TIGR02960 family)